MQYIKTKNGLSLEITVQISSVDGQSLVAYVNHQGGHSLFVINLTENGWQCYVHDQADPRRNKSHHPCTLGDAWELAHYPLYLGSWPGVAFPIDGLAQWILQYKEIDLAIHSILQPTWADVLAQYLDHELSDDEHNRINDHFPLTAKGVDPAWWKSKREQMIKVMASIP
jgi:hypothetical protein